MAMMLRHAVPPVAAPDGTRTAAAPRRHQVWQARQFTLVPQPAAVAQVRHAVQQTLHAWRLDTVADTATLLASELLTNAIQATAAAPASGSEQLALTLRHAGPRVLLEVWDPNPHQAIPQNPGLTDESGRGLLLIETLASAWGQRPAGDGKTVWCEITLPAAARQDQDLISLPRPA